MKEFVVTLICEDRPGLVELVSETIAENQGSWDESSMARLSGMFAGILHVHVDDQHADALHNGLRELKEQGITLLVSEAGQADESGVAPGSVLLKLALTGHDKPGIVQHIASVLAEFNVNVERLQTQLSSSSMSGAPLFTAHALLRAPAELDLRELQATVEDQASDLMVDIELDSAD